MLVKRPAPRSTFREQPKQVFQPTRLAAAILVGMGVPSVWADTNTIVAAGGTYLVGDTLVQFPGTATAIAVNGNVTDITTGTVRGQTGFNSFSHFQVGNGNTVNLYVPSGASNLVNLVHDSRVVINGTLNGVLTDGNRIGGNIIFADPHGMVVGSSGVINVGSLTITTPSAQQMQQLSSAVGVVTPEGASQLVDDLKNGQYNDADVLTDLPCSERGKVEIKGKINAVGSVNIFGAAAVVAQGAGVEIGIEITRKADGLLITLHQTLIKADRRCGADRGCDGDGPGDRQDLRSHDPEHQPTPERAGADPGAAVFRQTRQPRQRRRGGCHLGRACTKPAGSGESRSNRAGGVQIIACFGGGLSR